MSGDLHNAVVGAFVGLIGALVGVSISFGLRGQNPEWSESNSLHK